MTPTTESIDQRVIDIVKQANTYAVDATITRETSFADDLGLDSIEIPALIMELEDKFELPAIPEEDFQKLLTVGDAIDYVRSKVSE